MSTLQEKLEAIKHSVNVTRTHLEKLDWLATRRKLTAAEAQKMHACKQVIDKGERILKEHNYA